jgi:hypothetical protein
MGPYSQAFRDLSSAYQLNASEVVNGRTLVHEVLVGWHRSVEREPMTFAGIGFARLLRLLVRQ